jgi:hypothetical protein
MPDHGTWWSLRDSKHVWLWKLLLLFHTKKQTRLTGRAGLQRRDACGRRLREQREKERKRETSKKLKDYKA